LGLKRGTQERGVDEVSGGLAALLDDIAALARLAAASVDDVSGAAARAGAKATGVVIDDTAVTPQYVQGFAAERELPIIKKIAVGSLRNKLLVIVPVALVLSQFVPWLVTPLLMMGGAYLCYEGTEKVLEWFRGHEPGEPEDLPAALDSAEHEAQMVKGAVRTDFILSAEIMVIALNEVTDLPLLTRAIILVIVGFLITALVYGVVGLIVKLDDIGLSLTQRKSAATQRLGYRMVAAMPVVLAVLSVVGTVAMLWVGGHILLLGTDALGWHALYNFVHHWEEVVEQALGAVGGVFGWLVNTAASAAIGLVVGGLLVLLHHLVPLPKGPGH
jgi:uncharacterized protein